MKSVIHLCLLLLASACNAANILGFLPFYGISHNRVSMPLMEELARRGHNVTVAGYFEPKTPSPNLRTILFKPLEGAELVGFLSLKDYQDAHYMTTMQLINVIFDDYPALLKKNDYHRIYEGDYDLVIVEFFESDLFPAFASKLKAPFIVFHTSEALPWHRTILNEYNSPAEIPHPFNSYGSNGKMGFYERFWNTVEIAQMLFYYTTVIQPKADSLAKEHLGCLNSEFSKAKEASLYFVNTHFSFTGPRPTSPSTIEVGGLHVAPRKALAQVSRR
ncbi:UDP-glycosyltransferase activity [Nesidiocoris tenuis]|uniref:UDP-glycosyltransferase activity n=1 Tax=Nesidiocoris tenuis TaxID=355587 RepID=A0ABN7AKU1_9HEMI|nr:UDP-glycosyltransferase activity [Nesidiocoris tenuis]